MIVGIIVERKAALWLSCLTTAMAVILSFPTAAAAVTPPQVASFLEENLGMKPGEIASVEDGKPFVRFAESSDEREVALVGAVRIEVPAAFVGDNLRTISAALGERSGVFSTPAVLEDVAALSFPEADLDDLRKCEAGDCKIKLYSEDFEKISSEVDWSGDNVQEQVSALMRKEMVALVEDYRSRGDAAIPDYADKEQLMNAATGFDFLLRESPLLFKYMPDFFGSIRAYPKGRLPGMEDSILWIAESAGSGLKETISLVHTFVHRGETKEGKPLVTVARKKLHANHYYYAALMSATVVDHPDGDRPRSYMILLDRSLFDGKLGGFKKKMLRNGLKENLEKELAAIRKTVLELYREKK
jgi:hypothetical protein